MIIGTAGHVDHGKTALVRALTGIDTDRLKEERARGISIELGFAYRPVAPGLTLGFVDVPGHERFVHTMVAGAAGIDLALLVVAGDDGIMPQTLEHLAILELLGVGRGIVVITKADRVSPGRLDEVSGAIRELLSRTPLAGAPLLPVSALTGAGIEALLGELVKAAAQKSARPADARFRLAVDRVFSLPGVGLVVTGTVLSGVARLNDRLCVSPGGLPVRVRSIHAQNAQAERATAGERCALNLVGPGVSREALRRGDMILEPALHAPTDRIDARLQVLPTEPKGLSQWFPVRLHHAAAEVGARIVLLDGEHLPARGSALVQIVLERPIAAAAQDRFVIRDVSAQRTIGGGRFLDLRPPLRRRRTPQRRAQLQAQAMADPRAAFGRLLETAPYAWDLAAFARDRALSAAATAQLVSELRPVILEAAEARLALSAARFRELCGELIGQVAAFHGLHPDRQGIGFEQLRMALGVRLTPAALVAALGHEGLAGQLVRAGGFVRSAAHAVRLLPQDEAAWTRIAPLLNGDRRFRPPRVRDIAAELGEPEDQIRRLLSLAGREGRVDQVAHDHFFLRATVAEMVEIARSVAATQPGGVFTAAQVRDRLSNGRKVTIQILEFFDRLGITRQRGDQRRFREAYAAVPGLTAPPSPFIPGRDSSPVGRSDFKSD